VSRDTLVGTTLAGYSIKDMVGEGGTSAVYRADHPQHGVVALKVLREKLRQDRTAVARFLREAKFGTRVQHPNVVRTIETGETGPGLHFLAIEWAAGEILERYAKRNAPLPRDEVARIIMQIGDAVQAAHSAGIKLLDFGIAAATDTAPDERLTRAGFFVGTLMYVAPEALSGELVTPAADQYSLATIAYFLLTGCLPYLAKTPREMFTQLLSQPPIPLNRARPNLQFGPPVEAVIMRGLAKQPNERYPDVLTFATELRKALLATAIEDSGFLAKMKGLFRQK
jgi:serine/threonine-protein kinase